MVISILYYYFEVIMKNRILSLLFMVACCSQTIVSMQFPLPAPRQSMGEYVQMLIPLLIEAVSNAIAENPPFPSNEYIKNYLYSYFQMQNVDPAELQTQLMPLFDQIINAMRDQLDPSPNQDETQIKDRALHNAFFAENFSETEILSLIKQGANINQKIPEAPLLLGAIGALSAGFPFDRIKFMIEKCGVNIFLAPQGLSALVAACMFSHIELVQLLLKHGAPINETDKNKITPLIAACTSNNIQLVQLLLDHGADVMLQASENKTALDCAIRTGCEPIKILLRSHILLNAVKNNDIPCAKTLLLAGVNPNVKDCKGNTSLYYAIKNGNKALALLLLLNGAQESMSIFNNQGELPIHLAIGTDMLPFILKVAYDAGLPGYGKPNAQQ